MQRLTLVTYLSPSIPAGLYRLIADHVGGSCGIDTVLTFEERISGPLRGDEMQSWGPFPIQPSVVRASIDAELKKRIASALLGLHDRPGRELAAFGFERFVEADVAAYL